SSVKGIYIFIEFMDEMKRPSDFPKAIYTADLLLLFCYGFIGILGYAIYGVPVVNPITSALSAGKVKRVANGFLWIHVLISYIVTGLVFNRAVAVRFVKKAVDDFSLKGISVWFLVTLASTGLTLLLNIFFPYLSDIESLLGTLFSPITGFIYPPLFYWKCAGSTMSTKHKFVAAFVMIVFGVVYTVLGTYGTIYSIVQNVGATPLLYKCLYKK
ncbi:amino acid transporter, AAAP family, partial [Galdieria sulphuraria]